LRHIHGPEKNLILEVLPPYYFNFQFINFDPQELDEANKFFFEKLENFLIGMNRPGIQIKAIILHGGGAGKVLEKVGEVVVKTYTSKQEKYVEECVKFEKLKEKLPELEGIFE
jgi:hypothetical protein